jgi:hypothetical protein
MTEAAQVEMKLVGPNTFSSPKVNNRAIVNKGDVVSVDADTAAYLETLTYLDAANNEFPIWVRKGQKVRSRSLEREQAKLDAESDAADEDEDSAAPAARRARKK